MKFEMRVTDKAISYLSEKDPVLGKYISIVGPLVRSGIEDPYIATIDCVLSQQISAKAYQTIAERFYEKFKDADPELLLKAKFEDIRACGLSTPKTNYILGIAQARRDRTIDFDGLQHLSFEEIKETLTSLKGIGRWSVEMICIFTLQRLDVMSFDDLAIRNGIKRLYHKKEVTKDFFDELNKLYSPYQSYASFYLWHASQLKEDFQ